MAAPQPKTLEIPSETDDIWPPVELSKGGHTVRVFRTVNKDKYKFFTIAYYEHGKRQRKCVSKEATALSEARNTLKRLVAGESEAAGMRLSDVRAYESAKRLVAPTGLSLEAACKELADCIALLQGQCSLRDAVLETLQRRKSVVEIKTVADVVVEFIKLKRAGLPTRAGGKVDPHPRPRTDGPDRGLENRRDQSRNPSGRAEARRTPSRRPDSRGRAPPHPRHAAIGGARRLTSCCAPIFSSFWVCPQITPNYPKPDGPAVGEIAQLPWSRAPRIVLNGN